MLKNPAEYGRDTASAKIHSICHQVSPASIPGMSAGCCQNALVDESGMIRTQMGKHNRSLMMAVTVIVTASQEGRCPIVT
jgi:hypothetical protein